MTACTVYKEGLKMGAGDLVSGAVTVTGWTQDAGWSSRVERRNVQISVGALGTFNTQILTDGVTSLTLKDACPFTSAS